MNVFSNQMTVGLSQVTIMAEKGCKMKLSWCGGDGNRGRGR